MPSNVTPSRYAAMTTKSSPLRPRIRRILRCAQDGSNEPQSGSFDHIRFHREVLGQPEPVELGRRALVPRLDSLPELALVVAAGEGRRILLRLVLEDRLDLEAQLFLRQRDQPAGFVNRPLLPR